MIRVLIIIYLVLLLLGGGLLMTRCTANAVIVPTTIHAEQTARRPSIKKFERKQKERRKQEDKRKKEDRRERDDDDIGRPRFIFERQTLQEAL